MLWKDEEKYLVSQVNQSIHFKPNDDLFAENKRTLRLDGELISSRLHKNLIKFSNPTASRSHLHVTTKQGRHVNHFLTQEGRPKVIKVRLNSEGQESKQENRRGVEKRADSGIFLSTRKG